MVRVISRKALLDFAAKHSDAAEPLDNWYRRTKKADWSNLSLPKAIETEAEYERLLEEVNRLMSKGEEHLTPEENVLLELLFTLIEKFEEGRFGLHASTPRGILLELMEARHVKPRDLWMCEAQKASPRKCSAASVASAKHTLKP
jgi:antitoxin component HigA of HigAB toxin-antitoxin module